MLWRQRWSSWQWHSEQQRQQEEEELVVEGH
jgi:hypothetical protein